MANYNSLAARTKRTLESMPKKFHPQKMGKFWWYNSFHFKEKHEAVSFAHDAYERQKAKVEKIARSISRNSSTNEDSVIDRDIVYKSKRQITVPTSIVVNTDHVIDELIRTHGELLVSTIYNRAVALGKKDVYTQMKPLITKLIKTGKL